MRCSGHTSWWHDDTLAQSLDCAEKQTPLFSLRPTWQRLELCWHLSSLSGLILWLCSHGVRGKAGVATATPVDGAIELWERRAEGGAAATHQHRDLSLSIILTLSNTASLLPPSCRSVNLSLSLSLLLLRYTHCFTSTQGNKSVITAIDFQFFYFKLKHVPIVSSVFLFHLPHFLHFVPYLAVLLFFLSTSLLGQEAKCQNKA